MAKWYYQVDVQQSGPVDPAALKQLATTDRKTRLQEFVAWQPPA